MANHQQKQIYERTAAEAVERWNAKYQVGQVVEYTSHPEAPARTLKTRTAAFVLSGHSACIMLEEVRGCVHLDACKPVEASAAFDFAKALGEEALTPARSRLLDRLVPIAIEWNRLGARFRELQAAAQHRPLTEFALERGQLVREMEALAQQVADLHVSQNPHEESQ